MTSSPLGAGTSPIEVTNISVHGFWLLISDEEFFLPFVDYPWFREARIDEIQNVELQHDSLEADLCQRTTG